MTSDDEDDSPSNRSFKDPIHDYIAITPQVCAFVDTPQFQRLRHIKQLAACYYVWPGASHNRFEHCLGVSHLARRMVEHLRYSQPELDITDRDVYCVTVAGLCHDLGHGPWSHAWDCLFMPQALPTAGWKHEQGSEMMFDALVRENNIDIPIEDVAFIKALIRGSHSQCSEEKQFLFDIVANERNGIDVDKFDYILRDSFMVGDRGNLSISRLIDSARVIDNQICYDIKNANQIYELCHTRFSLHKRIYNHKTTRAIEHMIIDALLAANSHLNISVQVFQPEKFLFLTDDLMTRIESSDDPELAESRAIFSRIRRRDLYRAVDHKTFEWHHLELCRNHITPEVIVAEAKAIARGNSQAPDISTLDPKHVIVDLCLLHYGKKDKNPLNGVKFYSKTSRKKCDSAKQGDLSLLTPKIFGEVLLRVYTRKSEFFGAIQAGYRGVLERLAVDEIREKEDNLADPECGPAETSILTPRASLTPPPSKGGSFSSRKPSWSNNDFTTVPLGYGSPTKPRSKKRKIGD